jgi:quinol-cytochrome oxidoreductase complex cytochrome b subunit
VPVVGIQTRNVLLGAPEVGNATLLRFYVLHIYFVPALIFLGLGIHIWRVRKDGFAVSDRAKEPPAEPSADEPHEEVLADARP